MPPRANPYPGPRSFQQGERLYGRAREKASLLDLVIAERIVLLHSPSGAGKTSLLQASLIPALEAEGFRVLPSMRVNAALLSGVEQGRANRYSLSCILSLEEALPEAQQTPLAELAGLTLGDYLDRYPSLAGDGAQWHGDMLIFDQFEEVLTLDPTDRTDKLAFFEQVGQALRDRSRWAIFAMREEFVASLDPYLKPIPTRFDKGRRYGLELLGPAAAMLAMQQPARQAGVDFTDAAAARLVDDLRMTRIQQPDGTTLLVPGDSVEPVQLQVVCWRLWDRLAPDDATIDIDDIEAIGDVDAALRSYYAEMVAYVATTANLPERTIRDWVEDHLITGQEIRGQVLQGVDASEGLPNTAIWRLVDAHLLRAEQRRGATWFELAHDRLVKPVREDNAAWRAATLSPMQRQAAEWEARERPTWLLARGDALGEAEAWAAANQGQLQHYERAFLEASREAERQRARARRQTRLITVLAAASSVLAIIALVLFGLAQQRADEARNEALRARSGELAAASIAAGVGRTADPAVALILARQAISTTLDTTSDKQGYVTPLANRALLSAVSSAPPWVASFPAHRHRDEVRSAVFSPSCPTSFPDAAACPDLLLTASGDGTAKLWDAVTGELRATLDGHDGPVYTAAFSPDRSQVVTAGRDGTVRLWQPDLARPESQVITTASVLAGHDGPVRSASFSPDGRFVVSTGNDGTVRVWNAQSGKQEHSLQHLGRVLWASYDSEGARIASALESGDITVWDAKSGQELITWTGHSDWVRTVVWSRDSQRLLSASDDSTVRMWDWTAGQELARYEVPGFYMTSAVFSPDGRWIAAATTNIGEDQHFSNTIQVWSVESGAPQARIGGLITGLNGVAFSADGSRLVAAGSDQTARVWSLVFDANGNVNGGAETPLLPMHASFIRHASFSPDGRRAVTAGDDWSVRIWDLATGQQIDALRGHTAWVNTAVYSPDGQRILTASNDKTARLWDAASRQPLGLLPHSDGLFAARFSPGGDRVVTAGRDGAITVWDAQAGTKLLEFLAHQSWARWVEYSPDSQRIVSAGSDGAVNVWDATSGAQILTLSGHTATVYRASFSPDGQKIASASEDGTVRLWNAATGALERTLPSQSAGVMAAIFSAQGDVLITAGRDNLVKLWEVASGREIATWTGHQGEVRSAELSPDGASVITAGGEGDATARVWDLSGQRGLLTVDGPKTPLIKFVAFSPDGRLLVTGGQDKMARIWDSATGQPVGEALPHPDWVNYAAFSPDGSQLVTALDNGTARVWDWRNGRLVQTLAASENRLASVQFSADGSQILTASWDRTARLWDAATGQQLWQVWHDTGINFAAFSPTGQRVVTAGNDRTARIWDAAGGDSLGTLQGHTDAVWMASFSPDGDRVVTASADRTARVWDAATGEQIFALLGHTDTVYSAMYSPDSRTILSASRDGTARVWDASTGEQLYIPAIFDQRILAGAYSPDGSSVATVNLFRTETIANYSVTVWPATIDGLMRVASQLIQRDPPLLTSAERRRFGMD